MLARHFRKPLPVTWLLCTAVVAFLCVAHVRAQDDNQLHTASKEELEIVKVVLAQERAWNNGDLAAYLQGFKDSPDTVFMAHQISHGFAQISEDYKHNYASRAVMGQLTFSELESHPISETLAICLGRYHLDRARKDGGPADGLFSLVMEKTDSGWKIVLDHTN